MQQNKMPSLNTWVNFLNQVEIPVLKHTARDFNRLDIDDDDLSARKIAHVIKYDPMMTVKVMRYLQKHKCGSQVHEIMEVEQVVMMLGLKNSLDNVPAKPLVDELLGKQHMNALVNFLRLLRRAKQASIYAFDWAVRLNDLHFEEIRIAALLHNIAELLMWCFAPNRMLRIQAIQKKHRNLRSSFVQEKIFGFTLLQLQSELVKKWALPNLLITLIDDQHASQQRVRNVILAINLARHSANGWDDAALPDDYNDIAELLHVQPDEAIAIVNMKSRATK